MKIAHVCKNCGITFMQYACKHRQYCSRACIRAKPRQTLRERFEEKWIPEPNSGCWLWEAAAMPAGYGKIGAGSRGHSALTASRVAYELYVGSIPPGLLALHKCDNTYCVNPDHLFLGTQKANMEDKVAKKRQRPGEQHPRAILTDEIVLRIRAEYATGNTSLSKVGSKYGIGFQHVHQIVTRKAWSHI